MNKVILNIAILLLFSAGCASAPRQPINLTISNVIFASPGEVQRLYMQRTGKMESVRGYYDRVSDTLVIPTPKNWQDYGALKTIGHELMHIWFDHRDDYWLPGKEEFIQYKGGKRK